MTGRTLPYRVTGRVIWGPFNVFKDKSVKHFT
jgi:hypothetical protein